MSAAPLIIDDEAQWLELRRTCITATKIAAILGLHPYETPLTVYLEMTGQRVKETNEAMMLGRDLEEFIGAMYSKRTGQKVVKADWCVHKDNPRFGATPDYYVGDDGLVECKWAGQNAAANFGQEGTDEVPTHYLVQVQWQLFVTGRKWGRLVVLTGTGKFKVFDIKPDADMHRKMAFHARRFLGEYIDGKNPPPLSGHKPDSDYLKEKFQNQSEQEIVASYEFEETIADLGRRVMEMRALDLEVERLKNLVKAFMGEATSLKTDEGYFGWKKTKDRTKCDYEKVLSALLAYIPLAPDVPHIVAESERLIKEFTTTTPGSRRFTMPWKGDKA